MALNDCEFLSHFYSFSLSNRFNYCMLTISATDVSGCAITVLMKELIRLDPSLATLPDPSRGTRLPLNVAIESGRTWYDGVREFFHAAPQVLQLRDGTSGIYPFMLAATVGFQAESDDKEDSKPSANPQGCGDAGDTEDVKVGADAPRTVKRPRLTKASSNEESTTDRPSKDRQLSESRRRHGNQRRQELRALTTVFNLLTLDPTLVEGAII